MKELVSIKERSLKEGKVLYLDYVVEGKRIRENLHLYITKDKANNKKAYEVAETIKAKKILDIQNGMIGLGKNKDKDLFTYFNGCRKGWTPVRYRLKDFTGLSSLSVKKVDKDFIERFTKYLEEANLKKSTINAYLIILGAILRKAYNEGVILRIPQVYKPTPSESNRAYLTIEEVRKLNDTDCKHSEVKRAFLFSCFTGLRYSDVIRLNEDNISVENGYTRLTFIQKKTGKKEYLDICKQASDLLGNRCFKFPFSLSTITRDLKDWAKRAGINKNMTFHVARHTHATILLNNGVDIYTVSKLLGHRKITTTQIYAKLMDNSKRRAVNTLDGLLG